MNVAAITAAMKAFIAKHKVQFHSLAVRETALLEIGALTIASEHYRMAGYEVTVENAKNGLFVAKLSSRGHPYNFSWFKCTREDLACEIHSNLAVEGAHRDGAVYVVDVAVAKANIVPKSKPKKTWTRLRNADLITFVEVKKLVVYPMLLAQFVGIVHEIKPKQLRKLKSLSQNHDHFFPALISLGYLKGTSSKILSGFLKRNYRVCVIHNFDVHLSAMRTGTAQTSPFTSITELV